MCDQIDHGRRTFLRNSGIAIAAAELATITPAMSHTSGSQKELTSGNSRTSGSFDSPKSIDAGVLNVSYVEVGPRNGPVVILLHGWPYDIHSFADVVPLLSANGYRVIVPYLRGYGATRFLSADTFRNGEPAALAVDLKALMNALKIEKAILAGFDWGARTVDIVAALWPERCKALVSVSGYVIGSQQAGKVPLPPPAELQWWYQFYFATDRGRAGYEKYRKDFRSSSGSWPRRSGDSMTLLSIAVQPRSIMQTTSRL